MRLCQSGGTCLLFGSVTYKPQKLHLQPDMYRHISHFLLFHQINGVPHSLLWRNWLFGQENFSHVVLDNPEKPGKAGQSGHMKMRRRALFFFFFPTSASSSDAHLCSDMQAVSLNKRLVRKRKKKAFSFTTSYTRETPETKVGVQLFLVGLNFRSANTRGSTAYLLVMAILGCMNVSQTPRWPVEQRSTKILAQVFPIKTVNTSTGYCSVVLIHKLRPIITKSLGKPSILATSKHPSLL